MPNQSPKILIIGAGAVGSTIANWIAPHHDELYVLDQGETLDTIKKNGVSAYLQNNEDKKENVTVKTISDLKDIETPDYIFLCVKNYSLATLAKLITESYGNNPVIVAFQNGAENQEILPKYFEKVIYGVVCYNAWLDSPAVVGYQKKGPLVLGTPDNTLMKEMNVLQNIMDKGVETVITTHLQDAVLSKIIINLTNSFTTLVGFGYREIDNESLFQTVLSNLTYEGTQIAKAAGYNECKLGGMPSWLLIKLSAHLPQFLTRGLFRKNVAKMVVSSMAQDVIANKRGDNELESINGFLLEMAEQHRVNAPYNRAMYHICQEAFADSNFKPISIEEAYNRIQDFLANEQSLANV